MFGFRNFTGLSFVGKIGKHTVDFAVGFVEEVTFNVTGAAAANAAEIPDNFDITLISKDKLITSTSAVVSSRLLQTKVLDVIAAATPNLLI